jgi:hypothetical protein
MTGEGKKDERPSVEEVIEQYLAKVKATTRERVVFHELLMLGERESVSRSLGVSPNTLKCQVRGLLHRADAGSLAEMYRIIILMLLGKLSLDDVFPVAAEGFYTRRPSTPKSGKRVRAEPDFSQSPCGIHLLRTKTKECPVCKAVYKAISDDSHLRKVAIRAEKNAKAAKKRRDAAELEEEEEND